MADNSTTSITARLDQLEKRVSDLENQLNSADTGSIVASTKAKSLREFLNEKKPSTVNSRALCIAYFIESFKGATSFNADDIKAGFREAKIPVPKNPNDIVNKNIAKGLMMEADGLKDGKKAWVITATGEDTVEKGFGK